VKYSLSVKDVSKTYFIDPKKSQVPALGWSKMFKSLLKGKDKERNKREVFHALSSVSFKLPQGESLGIIGLNGSGKSTLLQIVAKTLKPTTGVVSLTGRLGALLELGSGFNPEFTGIENIYLNAAILGLKKDEIDQKLSGIISFADIGKFVYQPVKTFSTGMALRLAFAVLVHVEPEILIIDEALAVGDARFQAKCFNFLDEFQKRGNSLVLVSHDLNSVARLCSQVLILDSGKQVCLGPPIEVINKYNQLITKTESESTIDKSVRGGEKTSQNLVETEDFIESSLAYDTKWSYGGKRGEITSCTVHNQKGEETLSIESGETFKVIFEVLAHSDITNPIFAMKIRDTKGQIIYGQNSKFANVETEELKKGDALKVTFLQKANLGPGEYLISLGFTRYLEDQLQVIHRRHDILTLKVASLDGGFGISNCFSEIIIESK
jgi:ABC-type polysaccharide/polyol phosphate transport system ATPase subunit